MTKIVSRWNADKTLAEGDGCVKNVLERAVKSGADLGGADLRGAYLHGAYLHGAELRGAELRGADLRGAELRGADLGGAYLHGAYLHGAELRGAELRGAKVNWQSHWLISEILKRAAAEDVNKRMVAGLIAISTDWCWDKFLAIDHSEKLWAITELSKWVQPEDGAPDVIRLLAQKV